MPVKNLLKTGKTSPSTFAGKSALLTGGNLVKLLVQITILILYSRMLSVEEYGRYQSVWLFINVFGVAILFGLPSLLLSAGSETVLRWIKNNKLLFVCLALGAHLIPVLYLALARDGFEANTLPWLYALLIVQNLSVIRETLAVKYDQQKRLFVVQILFNLAWLTVHFLVLKSGYSLPLLISLLTLLCLLKAISLPWKYASITENNEPKSPGKQWLFLGLFDIVGMLFKWVDKWVILLFVSVAQFAIYFNGSYEIPLFPLLVSAAGSIMIVELSKSETIKEDAPVLFRKCMRYLAIPVLPSFFFLLQNHEQFFLFVFGDKYAEAVPVFFVALFVIPVRICHFTSALQALHRNDIVVKGAFLDLALAIILLIILYPLFGLPGLALAFVISTWMQAGYYLHHTARLLNKPLSSFIPYRYLVSISLFSLLILFIGKMVASFLSLNILFTSAVICAMVIGMAVMYQWKVDLPETR